jgi:hypothetical protein
VPPKPGGRARKRSRLRAKRYASREALHQAVLDYCREVARSQDPSFDVETFEKHSRERVRRYQQSDSVENRFRALRDVMVAADDYRARHPAESGLAALEGFFSTLPSDAESARTSLIRIHSRPGLLWWAHTGKGRTDLDLALVVLLSGCNADLEADRPTVKGVVTAEKNAVRAWRSRRHKRR